MDEVELTSDLLVALLDGIKSRKVIDAYYIAYDDQLKNKATLVKNFRKTIDVIGAMSAGTLGQSAFKSPVLFYSLFCAVHHHLHGLRNVSTTRKPFKESQYPKVWNALESVDEILEKQDPKDVESAFVDLLKRHTTDEPVRLARTDFLVKLIAKKL